MPIVRPEEDWDKTGWIALFMADSLPVKNMICVCHLTDHWDLSLKLRNRKLDRYHGCTMGMSTSMVDDETWAVSSVYKHDILGVDTRKSDDA